MNISYNPIIPKEWENLKLIEPNILNESLALKSTPLSLTPSFYTPQYDMDFNPIKIETYEQPTKFNIENLENFHYITNGLKNNTSFNDMQIAGIVAVMDNESSLNPEILNPGEKAKGTGKDFYKVGRGLCQGSTDRNLDFKKGYKEHYETDKPDNEIGVSDVDIDTQLEFMLYEMATRPAFLKAMEKITSPEEAADVMRRGFENGTPNKLATKEDLDKYPKVGGPNAEKFYEDDSRKANNIYKYIYNAV